MTDACRAGVVLRNEADCGLCHTLPFKESELTTYLPLQIGARLVARRNRCKNEFASNQVPRLEIEQLAGNRHHVNHITIGLVGNP